MTLSDLLTKPVSNQELLNLALVFSVDVRDTMNAVYEQYGNPTFRADPVPLPDGRYGKQADFLVECRPGYTHYEWFSKLDPAIFDDIEIVSWADIVAAVLAAQQEETTEVI